MKVEVIEGQHAGKILNVLEYDDFNYVCNEVDIAPILIEKKHCSVLVEQGIKLKEQETKKFDQGKPDFTLVPQEALLEVAKSFTYGADKYGVFNYSLGTDYRRYIAAAQRHINQWLRGEDIDESGTNHLSNAIASLMMVLDNQMTNKGTDNRNKIYKG